MGNNKPQLGDFDYSHRTQRAEGREVVQTGGIYSSVAGFFDNIAGSTDEAFARQFDDRQGGGLIDGVFSATPLLDQAQSTTERQAQEGILDEDAAQPEYVSQSDATFRSTDNAAPPSGSSVQIIRIRNGVANVSKSNPNRRQEDAQDVVSPEGAVIGIGAAAAGAAASGATLGSVAGPPGVAVGAAAGAVGSLLASAVEEFVGALGYTATAFIDGEAVGQTVASVGVPAAGIGQRGKNVELQHTVPTEPGQYELKVVVNMWQTGEVIAEMETDITVEEGRDNNTASNNDPSGSNNGGNGNGGNESGNRTTRWVINNPVKAGVLGFGGIVALRTAVESGITGE